MKDIRIHEATRAEISALQRFLVEAWREAGPGALGWTGATDEHISDISSDAFLSSLLERSDVSLLLAVTGDHVVGFVSTVQVTPNRVELSGIMVREEMRGQGVGTLLLHSAIRSARNQGFRTLTVKTEATNARAIRFYTRHHFKPRGTTRIEIDGTLIPLMDLTLSLQNNETGASKKHV